MVADAGSAFNAPIIRITPIFPVFQTLELFAPHSSRPWKISPTVLPDLGKSPSFASFALLGCWRAPLRRRRRVASFPRVPTERNPPAGKSEILSERWKWKPSGRSTAPERKCRMLKAECRMMKAQCRPALHGLSFSIQHSTFDIRHFRSARPTPSSVLHAPCFLASAGGRGPRRAPPGRRFPVPGSPSA